MNQEQVNVAAYLPEMARRHPDMRAVVLPQGGGSNGSVRYREVSFRELNELSDRYARGLERAGIRRGIRTALMVTPGLEFFGLTFALFKIGAVVVMIDPGIGIKNIGKCLAEAEPEAFIGIPKAHVARVLFRWASKSLKTLVTVGPRLFWGGNNLDALTRNEPAEYTMAGTSADEMAAILFTSGSTGVPKGAVYTHGIFSAQVAMLRDHFKIEPGEIDLPTFPLFALFDPALGMTAVIPEMDFSRPAQADPRKIIRAIQDQGVTNTFGSPALVNRVGRYGVEHGITLPTLKRVFSAGAPVAPENLERFRRMLNDKALIYTPYGATEALPVAAIESKEILAETRQATERGEGICVGKTVNEIEIRIIKITDDPIPQWSDLLLASEGEIGEIAVKGPIVTHAYFRRPDLTALAKIKCPDGAVYHRMGDVGKFDSQGRLWFCGRKSHRVITSAGTLFTIPCEAIFNRHPKVYRTALVGVGEKGNQTPVLCVECEPNARADERDRIRNELLDLGAKFPHTQTIKTILFHPAFPVDIRHNAKIGREKLALWATGQLRGGAAK